jgi:hypothetical protein
MNSPGAWGEALASKPFSGCSAVALSRPRLSRLRSRQGQRGALLSRVSSRQGHCVGCKMAPTSQRGTVGPPDIVCGPAFPDGLEVLRTPLG